MYRFTDRYEFRSRWHNLSALGTSPIVRLSILMPVAGYLILLNEQIVNFAQQLDPRFQLWGTGSPWRLVLIFYGTALLGVASILFEWRCPGVPKRYRAAVDFVEAERGFFEAVAHRDYLFVKHKEVYDALPNWARQDHVLAGGHDLPMLGQLEALTVYWHARDMEKPLSRIAIRVLYDLGMLLLAVPAVVTFLGVTLFVLGVGDGGS